MTSNTQSEPEEKPTLEGFVAKARKLTYSMPDRKSAEVFDALLDVIASIPSQISEAVKAEREACAAVAIDRRLGRGDPWDETSDEADQRAIHNQTCVDIAAAIRARGES